MTVTHGCTCGLAQFPNPACPVHGRYAHWKTRPDRALYANEPLYVTHEEMRELREMEAWRQRDPVRMLDPLVMGALGDFAGHPVVIDEEQRDRQAHSDRQVGQDPSDEETPND